MAEGGIPIAFDASTPEPKSPKKFSVELIDGFYKFKAMEEMNLKTRQFATFWRDCYQQWEKYEALLESGYSFDEVRSCYLLKLK